MIVKQIVKKMNNFGAVRKQLKAFCSIELFHRNHYKQTQIFIIISR